MVVFFSGHVSNVLLVARFVSLLHIGIIFFAEFFRCQFIVGNTDDAEELREHHDENDVESHEGFQVTDNLSEHHHQWSEILEDSEEEEGLDDQQQNDDAHQNTTSDVEWSKHKLANAVDYRSIDVEDICIVPRITQVICQSTSQQLREIIDPRIEDAKAKNDHIHIILCLRVLNLV